MSTMTIRERYELQFPLTNYVNFVRLVTANKFHQSAADFELNQKETIEVLNDLSDYFTKLKMIYLESPFNHSQSK